MRLERRERVRTEERVVLGLLGWRHRTLGQAVQLTGRAVEEGQLAVRVAGDDAVLHSFKHGGEEGPLVDGLPLCRPQFVAAALQLDEKRHLGLQHGRQQWFGQEVDSAQRVTFLDGQVGAVGGRDEQDRRVARARPRADQASRLEAIHAGHAHVEQDGGEVVVHGFLERFLTRAGPHQGGADLLQHGFERQQVGRLVIDNQDADGGKRGSGDKHEYRAV